MTDNINNEERELTEEELRAEMDEQHRVRIEKLEGMKAAGKDPYTITKFPVTNYNADIRAWFDELENKDVAIAGRIMSRRIMGKASFFDVRDSSDRMQVYVRIDSVGEERFAEFKKWDLGDIVGVKGYVFKTKTGEISVHASEVTLLSKSLLPLPEKWHGLKDKEERYRKRYLDLIANPEVKDVFVKRSQIISEIRKFLDGHGYIEVDRADIPQRGYGLNAQSRIYDNRDVSGVYRLFRNDGLDRGFIPHGNSERLRNGHR